MTDIIKIIQEYKKAISDTERTLAQDEGSLRVQEESLVKEIGDSSSEFVTKWLEDNIKEIREISNQMELKAKHLKEVFPL